MKKLLFGVLLLLLSPTLFYTCKKDNRSGADPLDKHPSQSADQAFDEAFNAAPVDFDGYELNEYHEAQNAVRKCRGQNLLDPVGRKECVLPVVKIYTDKANKNIDDLKASLEALAEKATNSTRKYEAVQKFYESRKRKIAMRHEALLELADLRLN